MYTVSVSTSFSSIHALKGGDFGPENHPNRHLYRVEVRCIGSSLDQYGFLLDINTVKKALQILEKRYSDAFLNELPEFDSLNPSLEVFARVIHAAMLRQLDLPPEVAVEVYVHEDESSWAAYTVPRS